MHSFMLSSSFIWRRMKHDKIISQNYLTIEFWMKREAHSSRDFSVSFVKWEISQHKRKMSRVYVSIHEIYIYIYIYIYILQIYLWVFESLKDVPALFGSGMTPCNNVEIFVFDKFIPNFYIFLSGIIQIHLMTTYHCSVVL